jgi:hypothetical protein
MEMEMRELPTFRTRRFALKAIAKLLMVCVLLGAAQTKPARAGFETLTQGVQAAAWTVAQQDAGTDAERRQAANQWLKRARQAIKDGNLELADDYVGRAEKLGVKFDSLLSQFSDSPSKVRRDIASARQASGKSAPPSQRFTPNPTQETPGRAPASGKRRRQRQACRIVDRRCQSSCGSLSGKWTKRAQARRDERSDLVATKSDRLGCRFWPQRVFAGRSGPRAPTSGRGSEAIGEQHSIDRYARLARYAAQRSQCSVRFTIAGSQ